MSSRSARLSLLFSCLGHAYMHLFAAFYFVIVLQLEREWQLPYHQVIELWTLGALFVGLGAIPAGWLGDHWSAPGMMVVMFLGMGAAAIAGGVATTPTAMLISLSVLGLFASIYHPVAIAWLLRNSRAQGKVLGINGIFGSLGIAGSGLITAALIDVYDWRTAFIVPGVVSITTGLALLSLLWCGVIKDSQDDLSPPRVTSKRDMIRGFGILTLTMSCMGLSFHAMQTALPKMLSLRLDHWDENSLLGIGALLAGVYLVSGLIQVVGGHLADRYPLKPVYLGGLVLQVPMLILVAQLAGLPLVVAATIAVFLNSGILPAENMLLARYTPTHRHGLAFGVKFVLAFATAPLAIILVSKLVEWSGDFVWVYAATAGLMALAFVAALNLPTVASQRIAPNPSSPLPLDAAPRL